LKHFLLFTKLLKHLVSNLYYIIVVIFLLHYFKLHYFYEYKNKYNDKIKFYLKHYLLINHYSRHFYDASFYTPIVIIFHLKKAYNLLKYLNHFNLFLIAALTIHFILD